MSDYYLPRDILLFKKMERYQGSLASCDSTLSTLDSTSEFWDNTLHLPQLDTDRLTLSQDRYQWRQTKVENNDRLTRILHPDGAPSLTPTSVTPTEGYEYYKPRRASSLKTNRTPPGTPKSKAVRFADAFGLDLEDVRHVFNQDLPPKIPASAVQDLDLESLDADATINSSNSIANNDSITVRYEPNFRQPGAAADFLRHIRMNNVGLENAFIENNILSGTVRVMNITFNKRVCTRVSFDNWKSHVDCVASYVLDSHDGVTDRFSFSLLIPSFSATTNSQQNDQPDNNITNFHKTIQFAICYECSNGTIYWDNNYGQNYCFIAHSYKPINTKLTGNGSSSSANGSSYL